MNITSYILFVLIGLILGLIGGGGSILGVPVLVYVNGLGAEEATAYSLFIVGISSLIGALSYLRKGELSAEAMLQFSIASMITVFCVRKFILPSIPEHFSVVGMVLTKNLMIMLLFAILILASSFSMIRKRKPNNKSRVKWDEFFRSPLGLPFVILLGVAVGFITGFVGAGGGFIIVPVLILILHLSFKKAIGTSLCIIAVNSLIGFTGNIGTQPIDWTFLAIITACCVLGILIGSRLAGYIPNKKLKPAFGWFTLIVGVGILVKELLLEQGKN